MLDYFCNFFKGKKPRGDVSQKILRTGGPPLSVDQIAADLENPRTQSELASCQDLVAVVKQVIEEAKEQ